MINQLWRRRTLSLATYANTIISNVCCGSTVRAIHELIQQGTSLSCKNKVNFYRLPLLQRQANPFILRKCLLKRLKYRKSRAAWNVHYNILEVMYSFPQKLIAIQQAPYTILDKMLQCIKVAKLEWKSIRAYVILNPRKLKWEKWFQTQVICQPSYSILPISLGIMSSQCTKWNRFIKHVEQFKKTENLTWGASILTYCITQNTIKFMSKTNLPKAHCQTSYIVCMLYNYILYFPTTFLILTANNELQFNIKLVTKDWCALCPTDASLQLALPWKQRFSDFTPTY